MNLYMISSSDYDSLQVHDLLGHPETPDLAVLYVEFCELYRYPHDVENVQRNDKGVFVFRKRDHEAWDKRFRQERFSENRMRKVGLSKCGYIFESFIEWLCRNKGFTRVTFTHFDVWGT